MFQYAGAIGPKHWWSRLARGRAEQWIENVVKQTRAGPPAEETPLQVIAFHRDVNGGLLDARIAAVEVLNLLRPTVATSVFITFHQWDGDPFNFIPQGGGDYTKTHRCPGEQIVIKLMKVAVDALVNQIEYEVPDQDLRIDFSRLPALPESGFVIWGVK